MSRKARRFRTVLASAFLGMSILPSALLLVVNEAFVVPRVREELSRRGAELAEATAESARFALDLAVASLDEVAFYADAPELRPHLTQLIDGKLRILPAFESILVLGETGVVEATGLAGRDYGGLDLSDLPLFKEPKAGHGTFFGNVFVSPLTGRASAFISRRSPSGRTTAGAYGLKRLSPEAGSAGPLASIRLVDGAGTVIASRDEAEATTQVNLRPLLLAAPSASSGSEGYAFRENGRGLLCFLADVAGTPWKVVLSYPDVYLSELPNFVRASLALAAASSLLLALLLSSVLATRVTKPVGALLAATRAFVEPEPAAIGPAVRELEELGKEFGSMRSRVRRREAELESALAQRDVLLKELHHRVKNNLQIVASLLALQKGKSRSAETEAALQESAERIRALALVHEKLYRSADFASLDLGNYLEELCANVLEAFSPTAAPRVRSSFDAVFVDIEKAIPIGLMANEIISNAAKHGTRPGERLALDLRLESRDGSFVLSISDEGPGFDIEAARAKGHLGMVLIESLVSQLGAELSVDASGPTRYELRVPLPREPAAQGSPPAGRGAGATAGPAGPATPCSPSAATGPQPA